jgi:hypothetical protein
VPKFANATNVGLWNLPGITESALAAARKGN